MARDAIFPGVKKPTERRSRGLSGLVPTTIFYRTTFMSELALGPDIRRSQKPEGARQSDKGLGAVFPRGP